MTTQQLNPHKLNPSPVQFTNNHVIYLDCGVATEEQIRAVIDKSLREVNKKLRRNIEIYYRINVVNRSGRLVGYSYVWFTNPEVYHMLTGKNPDGSERVELVDDPDWVMPDESREPIQPLESTSWADMCDEEERYICPKIKRALPPLMTLDPIEYVGDQKAQMTQLIIDKAKRNGTWKEGFEAVTPDRIMLSPAPAFCSPVDDDYYPESICAINIPSWMEAADFKHAFSVYASDPDRKVQRKIKLPPGIDLKKFFSIYACNLPSKFIIKDDTVLVEDSYPFIGIVTSRDRRMVFVNFDRNTNDALFCLLMCRKMDFNRTVPEPDKNARKPPGGKSKEPPASLPPGTYNATLYFNSAKKNHR